MFIMKADPLPSVTVPLLFCAMLVLLSATKTSEAVLVDDEDFGGVPLWINRLLGEPSVLSLHGRMDRSWFRANNPLICPEPCDCPIQWPTSVYCDHRGLQQVPENLTQTIQYLFLQGNNISSLLPSALANITGLRWLILDNNQLQSEQLEEDILHKQTSLYYLFANRNRLSSVPAALPAGLRELRLAHNQISSISAGAFSDLQNLTVLLLQGNKLQAIAQDDFKGLVSLNLLDLSGNLFPAIPKHLPPSVQQLYLSNNSLTDLAADSFVDFDNLKYLRLSGCGLESAGVAPEVFNVSSLVELDLSYNNLTTIPSVPTALQYYYLEANRIQEFNSSSFCREEGPLSYSRMKILRLDGNKLAYHHLPPDWVYCLRVLQRIFI